MNGSIGTSGAIDIDASDQPIRGINRAIRTALAEGRRVTITNPGARHNLAVALLTPGDVRIDGSVGYYCGGMGDGPQIEVQGSAGWGAAEGLLSGTVIVDHNAGNGAAAAIRGGTIVVRGTPDEVINHPYVIESYLGTGGVANQRSGVVAS